MSKLTKAKIRELRKVWNLLAWVCLLDGAFFTLLVVIVMATEFLDKYLIASVVLPGSFYFPAIMTVMGLIGLILYKKYNGRWFYKSKKEKHVRAERQNN
jgi:hypothetical protein